MGDQASDASVDERLPPEILMRVFSYLDVASSGNARLVSRQWAQIGRAGGMKPISWIF